MLKAVDAHLSGSQCAPSTRSTAGLSDAWKGIEVPAWLIEQPERITVDSVADTIDPGPRNCMIEIMTPERFVRSGGATRVAEDDTGVVAQAMELSRVTIGTWAAVEVVNGTAEADGSHKQLLSARSCAHCYTARESRGMELWTDPERNAKLLEIRT